MASLLWSNEPFGKAQEVCQFLLIISALWKRCVHFNALFRSAVFVRRRANVFVCITPHFDTTVDRIEPIKSANAKAITDVSAPSLRSFSIRSYEQLRLEHPEQCVQCRGTHSANIFIRGLSYSAAVLSFNHAPETREKEWEASNLKIRPRRSIQERPRGLCEQWHMPHNFADPKRKLPFLLWQKILLRADRSFLFKFSKKGPF